MQIKEIQVCEAVYPSASSTRCGLDIFSKFIDYSDTIFKIANC